MPVPRLSSPQGKAHMTRSRREVFIDLSREVVDLTKPDFIDLSEEDDAATLQECAICLKSVASPQQPLANYRGCVCTDRTFHAKCLTKWERKCMEQGRGATCPLCRGNK